MPDALVLGLIVAGLIVLVALLVVMWMESREDK